MIEGVRLMLGFWFAVVVSPLAIVPFIVSPSSVSSSLNSRPFSVFATMVTLLPSIDPLESLSSRERQVLQMLAEGHAVAHIAATLSLSSKTVETYRARMMEKLDIRDFASLVKFAIQHGITSLE